MRIKKKSGGNEAEGDLTPMIDMTFQLIAFFMVLINLSETDQNQRVVLPESTLAKPPDAVPEYQMVLQIAKTGKTLIAGQDVPVEALDSYLAREIDNIHSEGFTAADATLVIRAHKDCKTGDVQAIIQKCKDNGFEKFALRAEERVLTRGQEHLEFRDPAD